MSSRFAGRGTLRVSLWATAAVLLLAAGERGLRWTVSRYFLPTQGAQWIWAEGVAEQKEAVAFYALRDFDLESPPAGARVLIVADEEYILFVNGKRVGSNHYRPDGSLDEYEIADLLVEGRNRLLVELRSRSGAGGLLASLVVPGERTPIVVSDGSWRVFRQHHTGLLWGWFPAERGEPAFVWQVPRTGRWPRPLRGKLRPGLHRLAEAAPVEALSIRRFDPADTGGEGPQPGDPSYLLDWGREVAGYLVLELRSGAGPAHPVYVAPTPPDPLGRPPDTYLISMEGAAGWSGAQPRRFRYALVTGLDEVLAARVLPIPQTLLRTLAEERVGETGLFGLEPPGPGPRELPEADL